MKLSMFIRNMAATAALSVGLSMVFAGPCAARETVTVFHAGSLTVPFAQIEKDFEALHPDIDVQREAGGSTKMARMISELGKPADIMASADYKVIDKNLIPAKADWNIRFATNQLVLCYTDKSRFADQLSGDNWYDILLKKDVVWGHSDPNLDPCGYRSLMVLQLAEKHYGKPGLYDRLIANRPKENVRPKSVELVSLLKTGNMDYAWEYLSVAVQHGLKYLTLPDRINLGNYKEDDFYKQASVKVTGKKPGTQITRTGKSCTYGITLIKDAPNPKGAVLFMEYLLHPEKGLKVLQDMGQPPFIPARVSTDQVRSGLPQPLQPLTVVKP
ncbi:molybdate ABC transporter substrate-binding prot ein [Desulfonema ishimotonii]|uniref:Molybdate ABC transporter substrate-binding prot ein n=1 Tax=Desulfonema ishimotonii TaxID=45657 RepID=A0A401FRR4_9BACT|nr:tungstate ABC transporter substrate-binding protein WtpA [Desulfonema ishimotonii]GBC59654.1 molybdate ABC transporter substrate-binding prot ein [Desulfonema ishimotonii]